MSKLIKSKKFTGVFYRELTNKDKSYYISYRVNQKHYRKHVGKKSDGINEHYCYQRRIEALNHTSIHPLSKKVIQQYSFMNIVEHYFNYIKIHSKSYNQQYLRYCKHIHPYFKNIEIENINTDLIEQIQRDKLQTLSPKTVNDIIQLIGTIINHAINREIIDIKNPIKKVKKLTVNNERLRYLTTDEVNLLYQNVMTNRQLYLFVKLSLNTGARLHAITHIKKQDIDFENRIISLRDYKNHTTYKGFLQQDTLDLLKQQTINMHPNDYVLCEHTKMSNLDDLISKRLRPILNELFNKGIDKKDRQNRVVVHTLRHTFASHLAINGTPIFIIQNLMNHKDIKMTMRYAKLAPDSGREFVNKLYM